MLIFAPIGFARTRLLIGGDTRLPEAGTKTKDQKEYQSIIDMSLQILERGFGWFLFKHWRTSQDL